MEFISIEQQQKYINSSSRLYLRTVEIDLSALLIVKRPMKFKFFDIAAYYFSTANPLGAETLPIYYGWVTPKDSNRRTVSGFTATHIAGASGGVTTWNKSEDIMFRNQYGPWNGEVEAFNKFYVHFMLSGTGLTASDDTIVSKILIGYDV